VIESYRDLPLLYNQWCSVVRWEKTTRPFLRTMEFWWQEGHTMHETAEEALAETERQLETYARLCEEYLAIPVLKGQKTEKEKFAGAERTYTIEAMMHDGKALQSGTSHYFGDGFARAFEITFQSRENTPAYPHQTSWGLSTRIIGGIIMTHGDDSGLVLPPAVAPVQVVIVPVAQHKAGVLEAAAALKARLERVCRVRIDDSDNSPGWKFAQHEMKGVPLRLEIGPRDIEQGQCVAVLRHTREKRVVALDGVEEAVLNLLEELRLGIYQRAKERMENNTFSAVTMQEILELSSQKSGFIKTMWCGAPECEQAMKDKASLSSRCIPFVQEHLSDRCPICGRPAKCMVVWGKAY
jgi:prolyl-tRNA synthetase